VQYLLIMFGSHVVVFRDVSVELARLNSQLLHKFEYGCR